MISIGIKHINIAVEDMDVESVTKAVLRSGTQLNDDWVLSYDTKEDIIYHSTKEINKAIERLPKSYASIFNRLYAENEDIHDCIDEGLVDTITSEVMREVCPHSQPNKYFLTLQDYVEDVFVNNYNKLTVKA
jgi:hypothetical protein